MRTLRTAKKQRDRALEQLNDHNFYEDDASSMAHVFIPDLCADLEDALAALRERSKNYHYSDHPWGLRWEDCQQEPCISDRRRVGEGEK